jgi:hypothetical protein
MLSEADQVDKTMDDHRIRMTVLESGFVPVIRSVISLTDAAYSGLGYIPFLFEFSGFCSPPFKLTPSSLCRLLLLFPPSPSTSS